MTADEARHRRVRRPQRPVDGIVLLDKPAGLSSNRALQIAKRLMCAAKAGHAGTLDPLATGMLPLCFGQATKTCGPLLGAAKSYRVTLSLGTSTTTGDSEGSTLDTAPVPRLELAATMAALDEFLGERMQIPPMYSALKHGGRALYEIAREGGEVERPPRRIHIRALVVRACADGVIEFDVECSKGTYIRVLGEEIARRVGTVGHLAALRRLWVEPFAAETMVTLEELTAWCDTQGPSWTAPPSWLLPVDAGLRQQPRVQLTDAQARALRQGKIIALPQAEPGSARVYDPSGQFLGLVTIDAERSAKVLRFFVGAPPAESRDET